MLFDRIVRTALGTASAGFDVAVVRVAQELSKRTAKRAQSPEARKHYLDEVGKTYAAIDPKDFFAAPPPIAHVRESFVREIEGGGVSDVTWASGWTPRSPAFHDKWSRWKENAVVHARLFRHAKPRPAIVLIHGYRAGSFAFEERAWAAPWFYRLGLDVALFTLPFHALRAPAGRRGTPLFPSADVGRTNEAFGQAIWDLRGLVAWLRAGGASSVGVAGMSLGGYTTALAATVEPSLDYAIPYIPLSDMTDVVVEHEALRGTVVPEALIEAGKRAMAIHRPLARTPVVPGDRVLVAAADSDRITRTTHAERLAAHFGARIVRFPGAHLLQFGRREAFGEIARFLARLGVIEKRA